MSREGPTGCKAEDLGFPFSIPKGLGTEGHSGPPQGGGMLAQAGYFPGGI